MLDDILSQIQKPGRYIGSEWNIARKDFQNCQIKFALCFPDLYELGMSNLGLRILYGILNGIPDVACERFFSPGLDLESLLRKNNIELFSLESRKSLKSFDIIGFSLGYELNYTNVLNILALGKIPLKAHLRDRRFPLVIAGGPCAINPEPMHEFFDLFVIGEAEEAILEIISLYRKVQLEFKASILSKEELLILLSHIEGVYVPSLYRIEYSSQGQIQEFRPKEKSVPAMIKKRFVKDLNGAYYPLEWIVPYIQIVHDRITLEIMRGCPNACRFCQGRVLYFPPRERKVEDILKLAKQIYQRTGYEEISLAGLSVSDYHCLREVLNELICLFKSQGVSISLPSIKPKTLIGDSVSLIASIKKTGLTFAPEAGSERLRKILNKDFNLESFFQAIKQAYSAGYQRIKLYFMLGLPSEELKDLDGIIELACDASELGRAINRCGWVNISINSLIPKPHTPFQWLKMEDMDSIQSKIAYLKARTKNKRLKLHFHNPKMSFLEGVLSRGDRRLSQVIEYSFHKGARFDAWDDYFVFKIWQDAFFESNIDPEFYLKERAKEEVLPWDFLDTGVSKEILWNSYNKVIDIK